MAKKEKPITVDVTLPDNPDIMNIDTSISLYIEHLVYVSAEEVSNNVVFMKNKVMYYVVHTTIKGEQIPVGILVRSLDTLSPDIETNPSEYFRDVNRVVPIVHEKGFMGFYILDNGAVAVDYSDTYGGDGNEGIGNINMSLN